MTQTDGAPGKALCLPLGGFYYGFDLEYVVETVRDVPITPFPRLPDCYCGVCSHKGTVTPVVSLRRLTGRAGPEGAGRSLTVFLRCGEYECGVLTGEKPVLLDLSRARAVEDGCVGLSSRLLIRAACAAEEGVVLLVDIRATLEGLVVCE